MHDIPTRAELLAALDDPNPENPVTTAIAAVITSYESALAEQVSRAGGWPNPLVLPMPQD